MLNVASDPTRDTLIQLVANGNGLAVKSGGAINIEAGGGIQFGGVDLTAPIAALANNAARYVAAGSAKSLTSANDKQTIELNALAGSIVTLPAATGSGVKYRFVVTVLPTSNSHVVQVASASDFMVGSVEAVLASGVIDGFSAANSGTVATNSDTITLNRSTTGGVHLGEYFSLEDLAANTWLVSESLLTETSTGATPFSAAV
jgi:hypothetical protein